MIGEVIGPYRVVARLGAGGMGTVWLAEHSLLGRRVAIKFLLPELSQNQGIVERFFAEARAATRIADPGIVVIYDFGWHTSGAAYIVMEHLNGESMQARLRNGRLAVIDAVRLIQQAALAMAVAHAAGIIHRDLKPDNLFVVRDPVVAGGERIKILDFGIAKLLGEDPDHPGRTRTGVIMGTPTYMSPEQCRGAGDVDHRTDIYALGCVLFHLLCGRPPFLAASPGEMIAAHLTQPPPLPSMFVSELSIEIDTIVARCIAKEVGDRYASMTELARALSAAIGAIGEIASIPPVRAVPRDRPSRPGPDWGPGGPDARGEPAIVARGAQTVADTGPALLGDPRSGPPSTISRSAGESMPSVERRGSRLAAGAIAVGAVGAIVAAIIVAVARPPGAPHAPGGSPPATLGSDAATDAVIDPVIDAPLVGEVDAIAIDAGVAIDARGGPRDAATGAVLDAAMAARLDAPRPGVVIDAVVIDAGPAHPAADARRRVIDAAYDPYAEP